MRKNTIMKIIKKVAMLAVVIPLVAVIALKISHYVPTEKVKSKSFTVWYEDKAYYAGDRIYINVKSSMPDRHVYTVQLLKNGKVIEESSVGTVYENGREDSTYFEDFGKGDYTVKVSSDYGEPAVKTKKIEFK
ncbi:hypothetical protein HFZ78_23955 [Priestia megaterium]|uniref:Uncharacterized protein n=1 Tax=Priestia megaterium TaxID=1404 RepID=A0A6H1P6Y8_PRIMG|nr:hypothetical protein [Priestia megaterium]QIZ09374.1 hypothetical protein HFZ78_23955 [Priestia megaterium]